MRKGFNKFKGTGVAIVTPFKKSGAIDFQSYEKILTHVIHGGVDFIVVLGTTGEAPTISKQEKKALIEFSVEKIEKRVPVLVGIGGNSTSDTILTIHGSPFKGVDGILSVCPYYNKPQQEGLYQHFKTIAEASPVPVILYTVPGRTGSNLNAATTLRLANDFENIIGIKEASANFDQIFQVLKNRPKDFLVLSGDDALTLPLVASGADGVISVTANAFPHEVSQMVRYGLAGQMKAARSIHYQLLDFTNTLFADGSPAGIKAALEIKKLCQNNLRLPLVNANHEVYKKIRSLLQKLEQTN
ncbi:MAG: 4-hydroxy-tetrahydrodipicolinate synthase [Alphaproteobacteria bacterium]|nr:4-hydroxy-tetrahydrodipicolinate synthase [Alphaproteobacteria bacterium]